VHRAIAQVFQDSGRFDDAVPHLMRCAEPGDDDAIEAMREALARAERREAYLEALRILAGLVDLLPAADERWLGMIDALVPDAQWVVAHRADSQAAMAVPALTVMDEAVGALDDPGRHARVKFRLATLLAWSSSEPHAAEPIMEAALCRYREAGDRRGELLARYELAFIRAERNGDLPKLRTELARVVDAARDADDQVVMAGVVAVPGPLSSVARLATRAGHRADHVPGLDQPRDQSLPDHAGRNGQKDSHD
jgi:hypothetical protein